MSENNNSARSGGVSVVGLLGVAFVILKLCHVIHWPWLWVLAPFWLGIAVVLAIWLVVVLVAVLAIGAATLGDNLDRRKRMRDRRDRARLG